RLEERPRMSTRLGRLRCDGLANPWCQPKREQSVVGNTAQRRTQNCGERQLISAVIKKATKLDQVPNFFALVKAFSQHCLKRNARSPKFSLINRHVGHRAKQHRNIAVFDLFTSGWVR